MDLKQAEVTDERGARRAHAEQQPLRGAVRARQVPGVGEYQPRNLGRPRHGKECAVGSLAGITHPEWRWPPPAPRGGAARGPKQGGAGGGGPPRPPAVPPPPHPPPPPPPTSPGGRQPRPR